MKSEDDHMDTETAETAFASLSLQNPVESETKEIVKRKKKKKKK